MDIDFYAVRLTLSDIPVVNDWLSVYIFIIGFFSLICKNYELIL